MRKSEPLISYHMWRNIFVQAIYQLVASLVLLFAGHLIFHVVKDSTIHYTIVFNAFVWMQLFNEVNSRKLLNEKNMFAGIRRNPMFLAVITATIVVQILFVQVCSSPSPPSTSTPTLSLAPPFKLFFLFLANRLVEDSPQLQPYRLDSGSHAWQLVQ